ncbi:HIS3, partial [Symbiodinium pilosum]
MRAICQGDTWIDDHHSTEDVMITVGKALADALGDKAGCTRMGWAEGTEGSAKVLCVMDLSNRPGFCSNLQLQAQDEEFVDDVSVEMIHHCFESFVMNGLMTVHLLQAPAEAPATARETSLAAAEAKGQFSVPETTWRHTLEVFGAVHHEIPLAAERRRSTEPGCVVTWDEIALAAFIYFLMAMTTNVFDHGHVSQSEVEPTSSTQTVPTKTVQVEPVVEIPYEELKSLTPGVLDKLRKAFVGPRAYGAVAITGIPGYAEKRHKAFRAGIDLALLDPDGRARAAAVNNTYPGWSGTPGSETHPLQSSFLFNVKEELPNGKVDPFFGKNIFPSEEYRRTWVQFATSMYSVAVDVLRGCDKVLEQDVPTWTASPRSLAKMGDEGPALAGRFICYDSGFTREDRLLQTATEIKEEETAREKTAVHHDDGDGLASMRTHATPVKSAGHAADGMASMRTPTAPVKSAGHAGDGLASMRTHTTPVKSAGHAGDGLASMRTHTTPVKSAGHAGDGLASMRTHTTPVKSAGHAGDGLASMRTHTTLVK